MGNASSYTSIEGNDELVSIASSGLPQSSSVSSFGSPHRHGRRLVLVALVVCAVLALVVVKTIGHGTQEIGAPIELEASSLKDMARACTFKECYASNCDHESAPFTCIFHNGGPHGGCSATPWIEGTCEDQCDLTKCDSLEIPDTVDSCKGVKCGKEWCAGAQVCPKNVPYQCTSGSARFGCSTDSYQWSLRVDVSTCSACCDTSMC